MRVLAMNLLVALLLTVPGSALAKKGNGGGKPPDAPPPGADADPAIVYEVGGSSGKGSSIHVANSDGTNQLTVLQGTRDISYTEPSWSPDGTRLVFRARWSGGPLIPGLYTIDMEKDENDQWTGEWTVPLLIAEPDEISVDPAWRPQAGDIIAYTSDPPGSSFGDILTADPNIYDPIPDNLTQTESLEEDNLTWSADGTHFAVVEWHPDISDIVVYDFSESSPPKSLLRDPLRPSPIANDCETLLPGQECLRVSELSWSRTQPGLLLAAVDIRIGTTSFINDIWCIEVDALENVENITMSDDRDERSPSWSPSDGQFVVESNPVGSASSSASIRVVDLEYHNGGDSCPRAVRDQQGDLQEQIIIESGRKNAVGNPEWRRNP